MTKKEMFAEIINLAIANDRADIVEFANKEIGLIEKRANTETKAQKIKMEEREELKTCIIDLLSNCESSLKTSEIAEALKISTQKTTPMLKALIEEGKIEKIIEKRVSYFKIVGDNEDTEADINS